MEKVKDYFLMACLVIGMLMMTLVPFIYNILHPSMTQFEVFFELWWVSLLGLFLCFISLYFCKKEEKKKGSVPKMRNPPPPPEKKNCNHIWKIGVCTKCGKASWR